MTYATVKYLGIELAVQGKYYKGSPKSYETPADPPEFELYEVNINDIDITPLLSENQLTEIEQLVLETF